MSILSDETIELEDASANVQFGFESISAFIGDSSCALQLLDRVVLLCCSLIIVGRIMQAALDRDKAQLYQLIVRCALLLRPVFLLRSFSA